MTIALHIALVAAIAILFVDVARLRRNVKRLQRRLESEIEGRREFMQ